MDPASIGIKPYIFVIFQGVYEPPVPDPSGSAHEAKVPRLIELNCCKHALICLVLLPLLVKSLEEAQKPAQYEILALPRVY